MKKSLKYTLLSLMLATSLSAASAVDFGGMITNDSKFSGNTFGKLLLEQKNSASAWLRIPFNNKGTTYFTAEGVYQFVEKDIKIGDVDANSYDTRYAGIADLSLFKFATSWKKTSSQISLSVGRFHSADLSGLVFSQTADGLLAKFDFSRVSFSLYGAYTGLLNARTVKMVNKNFEHLNGAKFLTEYGEFSPEDTKKHYQRAESYVIGSATLSFPNLFASQTISLQGLGTFKMKDQTDTTYSRIYAELSIGGPLVSTLYYNINTTFGFSKYDSEDFKVGNLSKVFLTYYAPVKNITLSLGGVYASGENGGLKPFVGFTSQTATNALQGRTEYSGIIKPTLAFSIKPVQNLLLGASGDIIINAAESPEYEGFQYGVNANWQIVSDVMIGASMYQYFDNDDKDNRNKSCVQLKAAISF